MALYFLEASPTYRKQISNKIYRRREVVCKHLKDNYKAGKHRDEEVYQTIASELTSEGIEISESEYRTDKVLIRTAYLWLISTEEEKQRIIGVSSGGALTGVNRLIKDGMTTWADLKLENARTPEAATVPHPPRLQLSEYQAGREVVETFTQLAEKLEVMLAENERLKEEVNRLTEEAGEKSGVEEDFETYIRFVESENAALEERVRAAKEGMRHLHSASLGEIAEQHPEFPELFVIAQKMKQGQSKRQELIERLQGRLPQIFTWANDTGSIKFERHFLRAFAELTQEEQEQVIRQMEAFAQQGPEQASLHTRKSSMRLPYSPQGCMTSRGASDLRFTWKKNDSITIYWLFRKGDTRVRQVEQ